MKITAALLMLWNIVAARNGYTTLGRENKTSNGMMVKKGRYHIPSFMIIGAQKGGTSDLQRQLTQHPLVAATKKKEAHFFDKGHEWPAETYQKIIIKDLHNDVARRSKQAAVAFLNLTEQFLKHEQRGFNPSERVFLPVATVDATPAYLFHHDVARRIKNTLPWMSKMVVSLRNPVERAYSAHRMFQRRIQDNNETFEELLNADLKDLMKAGLVPNDGTLFDSADEDDEQFIDVERSLFRKSTFRMPDGFYGSQEEDAAWERYFLCKKSIKTRRAMNSPIGRGLYSIQIRSWLRHFDMDSFLFLKLEDSMESSNGIQERYDAILDFLGLPGHTLSMSNLTKEEVDFAKQHQKNAAEIKASTKRRLEELFEPYNEQLSVLLGPGWENPW